MFDPATDDTCNNYYQSESLSSFRQVSPSDLNERRILKIKKKNDWHFSRLVAFGCQRRVSTTAVRSGLFILSIVWQCFPPETRVRRAMTSTCRRSSGITEPASRRQPHPRSITNCIITNITEICTGAYIKFQQFPIHVCCMNWWGHIWFNDSNEIQRIRSKLCVI